MVQSGDDRLAAMLRELEKQDAEWARVKEDIHALGDVEIAVPTAMLEELEAASMVRAVHQINLQAVRG